VECKDLEVEIRIGRWRIKRCVKGPQDQLPSSFFLPLLSNDYDGGPTEAHLEEIKKGKPSKVRIMSRAETDDGKRIWLHEGAQVLLDAEDGREDHRWPLRCAQERGT